MSVKERIRYTRIIEKIERNKAFSSRIGIRVTSEYKKVRDKKDEVHRLSPHWERCLIFPKSVQ